MPPIELVDPELREAALRMREVTQGYSPLSLEKLSLRREAIAALAPPWLDNIPVQERTIPGLQGQPDVTIFIVNAKPGTKTPAILHLHGGGFNAGSSRAAMSNIQDLAASLGCVVVSVEYRLAPETPFPGALHDNHAALIWLHNHASEIGADPTRIAILGESAGGGHAAMLALQLRNTPHAPNFLALLYPMLDDRTGSTIPVPAHIGAFGWNVESNIFGWQCLLGHPPGTDATPEHAAPARAQNLTGLPPTFIGTGALDQFVSENIEFARRLIESGVPTELVVAPGAIHGFDMLAKDTEIARRFTTQKLAALRRALSL
jgi:acetyl esterase/lipase